MKNYYKILGIANTANIAEIKKSYIKRVKETHPDNNSSDPYANEKMAEINEAYEILGDPIKRQNYDSSFRQYTNPNSSNKSNNTYSTTSKSQAKDPRWKKGNIIIGIVIVIWLIASNLLSSNTNNVKASSNVKDSKSVPTPTKSISKIFDKATKINQESSIRPITLSPTTELSPWEKYTTTSQTETQNQFGFNIGYPAGWIVNYRTNPSGVEFDIAPSGWTSQDTTAVGFMGYATMTVTVHPHYDNINDYIANEYEQFYQGKIEGVQDVNIGNEVSYLIQASPDSNSIFQAGWVPRSVVLGNSNSYEINFGNGGSGGSSLIKEDIWPMFRFY